MADLNFDVVIVGGGTKGLSTGMYLAKYGGMSVGIFEELHELGGGLAGDQISPGVQCNTHAGAHQPWYYGTIIKDDFPELYEEGLKLGKGMSAMVYGFDDGTALTLYGTEVDPDGTRSAAQMARFSQKDAETYLKMRKIYFEIIQAASIEEAYSLPAPFGTPGPLMKALHHPEVIKAGLDPYAMSLSGVQTTKYFYESIEAQYMILRMGEYLMGAGVGLQAMTGVFSFLNQTSIVGGTHNLAHALHRVLYKYGAKAYTHSTVKKVIIENGVAKGIELVDGTRISAKKAVISTLSPMQLANDLIGRENLSREFLKKIDGLESTGYTIVGMSVAFSEPPKFKCSSFNPDVYSADMRHGLNYVNLGPKTIESLIEQSSQMKAYLIPGTPVMRSKLVNIITDPDNTKLSRDTKATQWLFFNPVPAANNLPPDYWIKFQHEYPEWQLDELKKYTDGATWDNVTGVLVRTPYWVSQHLKNMGPSGNISIVDVTPSQMGAYRPIPELAYHRTPIKGLYATGAAFGNWGMSSFCSSYTCYKIMAEDLGLRMPWKEKNRAY